MQYKGFNLLPEILNNYLTVNFKLKCTFKLTFLKTLQWFLKN